ncbi:hypothetical protein Fcan01_27312 [Folsomia candida]|uniref:Uncharacterized protein n=1 Tax=Folsomia candida TaxID=158441 RepID=A0A226CY44_FOLCA|nr:hypothetical protein Fcan01_27312 [Folsomia candida]
MHCNVLPIAEKRNFTLVAEWFNKNIHLFCLREDYEIDLDLNFLATREYHEWDYFPSVRTPFNFYVIITKPNSLKGFQALIEPFPIDTWVLVLCACAIVAVFIYAAECRHAGRLLLVTSLLHDFWFVYSILIFQSSSRVGPLAGKWGFKAIWIVGCFLLSTIIISSLYQGELSTAMTTIVYPFIPLTLEDLAKSSIRVITAGRKEEKSNLDMQISTAKSHGVYGPRVSGYVEKIQKRIFLLKDPADKVGIQMIQADKLLQYGDGEELAVKGNIFAIMDTNSKTAVMANGISLSPDFIVFKGREDLAFDEDDMWTWERNFFTKLYKRSWLGLVEGGFSERFNYLNMISLARLRMSEMGNYGREHFLRVLFNDRKNKGEEDFLKINQESMLPCYYFFLLLLSFTLITFFVEVCIKFRNRVRHIRKGKARLTNMRKFNFYFVKNVPTQERKHQIYRIRVLSLPQ